MVIFEAPHRLYESLVDAASILGADRAAAICREMTKTHEETIRGPLSELIAWAAGREVLGEITLVIAGVAAGSEVRTADDAVARVREYEVAGVGRQGANSTRAEEISISKKNGFSTGVEGDKKRRRRPFNLQSPFSM